MERETLLAKLLNMLREDQKADLHAKIEAALAEQVSAAPTPAEGEANAMRFLKDLDIFVSWRGADFIYSRGIAESLRVGEDIWELAYQFKHAMRE
ncbi:MAG: hypothetical protein AUJ49_11165 [Desulfovibrionaceae bacterium CG1_02_65_16]|nr:MAG: hypothetical protein AUJ49_11165 [Desulfovibrionaceae bacterium CG1_02_65_16]